MRVIVLNDNIELFPLPALVPSDTMIQLKSLYSTVRLSVIGPRGLSVEEQSFPLKQCDMYSFRDVVNLLYSIVKSD